MLYAKLFKQKCFLILTTFVFLTSLSGDIVHLENGGQLEGKVTDLGDRLKVEYSGGTMTVAKSSVKKLEQKALPEQIFVARLDKLNDPDACIKLAEWALSKNLDDEYARALRKAIMLDPDHQRARTLLQDFALHFSNLPVNEEASRRLLADSGPGFQIYRTRHFRIAYNTDPIFAEMTAERLEKLYEYFMIFFQDRHFEPAPLTDRLEVVLYNTREEFKEMAVQISADMTYASGFYAHKTGRGYFYDSLTDNNYHYFEMREKINSMRRENDDFRQKVLANRDDRLFYVVKDEFGNEQRLERSEMLLELDERDRMLNEQTQQLIKIYREQNITVTIHEGTHQLAYKTGIHNPYIRNPLWLVEGLAMYFEAPGWTDWEGPGQINQNRLQRFIENTHSQSPVKLKALIASDRPFELSGSLARDAYAASWALFYYLTNRHHEKLFDYMYNLSLKSVTENSDYTPEKRLTDFQEYFGKIEHVERDWYAYMKNL